MITVISGEPGNGKTAYVVSLLLKEVGKRPIYVFGIPDLTIEHERTPPVDEWTELVPHEDDPSIMVPRFTFPDGSLIVVDEAQDVYKPRPSGSKVPPISAALERHRHKGLDFILITQKPMLLDSHCRNEAGKHIHIRSDWKGRELLEWPSVRNPTSSEYSKAIRIPYKLPKQAFGLYKSATLHVKPNRRIPRQVFYLVAFAVALVAIGFRLVARVDEMTTKQDVESVQAGASGGRGEASLRAPTALPTRPAAPEPTYRLVSFVYVAISGDVRQRYWVAEGADGKRQRIDGERCAGEGRDAYCTFAGKLVRF